MSSCVLPLEGSASNKHIQIKTDARKDTQTKAWQIKSTRGKV